MKKQNEVSGLYATATVADDHGNPKDRPFQEIVPDGPLISSLGVSGTQRIIAARRSAHRRAPPSVKESFSNVLLREFANNRNCRLLQSARASNRRDLHRNCCVAGERPTQTISLPMGRQKGWLYGKYIYLICYNFESCKKLVKKRS